MSFKVFYSWHSDLSLKRNRYFVEEAAKRALKQLRREAVIDAALDRDTKGIGGTPDIADTIFTKIRECDAFLVDVTPVSRRSGLARNVPNPNVMTELGFAIRELGWEGIVCVMNTAYASWEQLPFHLKQRRRPIMYSYGRFTRSRGAVRDQLARELAVALEFLGRRPYPRNVGLVFADSGGRHHDTHDGRRILHTRIENVAGMQLCSGTLTVSDMAGTQLSGFPVRFSSNAAPTLSSLFGPETWHSTLGMGTEIPLAIKTDGDPNAYPFTSARYFFPNVAWPPALHTYALAIGRYRARVSIMYGAARPAEKEFVIKNDGPGRADLTLEDG